MEIRKIEKEHYYAEYDSNSGEITGLYDWKNPKASWTAEESGKKFGIVFLHGTQWGEDELPFATVRETEDGYVAASATGTTVVQYRMEDDRIQIAMKTGKDCGPRMGLQMNFNLLDMPTRESWQCQCMPRVIYTDENNAYAYFVFGSADGRFLGVTVNEEFAAWRIKYSYDGHKMTGFQILSQADDVKCEKGKCLPDTDRLSVTLLFADGMEECLKKIAGQLGIVLAMPGISGGVTGCHVPLQVFHQENETAKTEVIMPDKSLVQPEKETELVLSQNGMYQIRTYGKNGRCHVSRVFCHAQWKELYTKINGFYREHFQDQETGAFYRVIRRESMKPDGVTFEGVAFGNPHAHFSCRTGEFGGFAAWAMMKNCLLFGENEELLKSIDGYVLDWALNRGHEDQPYYGTVYKKLAEYMGRSFGAYHLFEELNYVQHELFLLEELVDYVRLTKDENVLKDAIALADHVRTEHLENGAIINENFPGKKVDYSTVHSAISGFLALAVYLREQGKEEAERFYGAAEQIADHVCRRALDFPTEGEPCTEDGSMSCSVITLLSAYLEIAPKKEYLEVAQQIMDAHRALEMNGADCRMKNSTIRFWETQYESHSWGPSVNAGHGWTIWNAQAKALYARIRKDFSVLKESYEGFVTNMCKMESNGGMRCCYTPDMIPGTPHAYYVTDTEVDAAFNDERPTSVHLGCQYVPDVYANNGNFFLVRAADFFSKMSGYEEKTGIVINGTFREGVLESAAPHFDWLLLKGVPKDLTVRCKKGQKLTVALDGTENSSVVFENAEIICELPGEIHLETTEELLKICGCEK